MQKRTGISLIVLVITIIVMIILAGAIILTLNNSGIIDKASEAVEQTDLATVKELAQMAWGDAYARGERTQEGLKAAVDKALEDNNVDMEQYEIETTTKGVTVVLKRLWVQNGLTLTDGRVTLTIGDYVNYDEGTTGKYTPDTEKGAGTSQIGGDGNTGYILESTEVTTENLTWRILGVNSNGQLELISTDPTTQKLYLANAEGYIYAEDNLNNFCNELYGKGKYAESARSLNLEDIDKFSNFDKTKNNTGAVNDYGIEVEYFWDGDATPYYKGPGEITGELTSYHNHSGFYYFKDKTWTYSPVSTTATAENMESITKFKNTSYDYVLANEITTEDGFTSEEITMIDNMISRGTGEVNLQQWLASKSFFVASSKCINYGVYCTTNGGMAVRWVCMSTGYYDKPQRMLRPVVTLNKGVKLSGTGSNIGSSTNMWQLSN